MRTTAFCRVKECHLPPKHTDLQTADGLPLTTHGACIYQLQHSNIQIECPRHGTITFILELGTVFYFPSFRKVSLAKILPKPYDFAPARADQLGADDARQASTFLLNNLRGETSSDPVGRTYVSANSRGESGFPRASSKQSAHS